jgi:HlyD family secretion protein
LQQVRGSVTDRDILAAEARLQQARARLAELERASNRPEVVQAGARLEEARATLESEKTRLSAAKTDARLRMEQAVEALTRAQSAWVVAKNEWDSVQADGQHPTLGYGLNEAEKRKFYDAFIQAETALRSAESSLEQARVAYDAARQAEAAGVSAAGQRVAEAQAAYDRIVRSTNNDELAAARAEVADAQARLERLRGEERAGAIAVAEATLAEARANLARLKAGPTAAQIAEAEADVRRATAALQAAQTQLDELTLRAPFGGLIAAVNIKPGEYVTPGAPLITLGDPGAWQIETTDLTELSIVKVQPDAPVTITFDALPGVEMQGRVTRIRELGENRQGDITYRVIITPTQHDTSPALEYDRFGCDRSTVTTTRQGSRCDPWRAANLAGRAGFEPARGCYPLRHFQCRALGHYATSPCIHLDNPAIVPASCPLHGVCDRRKESCCNLSPTLSGILYTIPAPMLQYVPWLVTSCVSPHTTTFRLVG